MFTLIFVLWVVVVSTILAFNVNYFTSWDVNAQRALVKKVEGYPTALLVLKLVGNRLRKYEYGKSYTLELGNQTWSFTVEDAGSGLDPNSMTEDQFRELLRQCGVETGERMSIIVDSFLDWKDEDSARRLNGAEEDYYKEQGKNYKPRNGKILDVKELLYIRGMDAELFKCIRPFLNIYGQGKLSLKTAPYWRLRGVGLDKDELDRVKELREDNATQREWQSFYDSLPEDVRKWVSLEGGGSAYRIVVNSPVFGTYRFLYRDGKVLRSYF